MRSTHLILVTILTWPFSEGKTIYKKVVLINATTKISCFPNEAIDIQWHHTAPGRSPFHLYAGGRFYVSNRGFLLEKDSNTGPYHLVISHARTEDAGLYECKEDAIGSRVFGSTQLTVLESSPVCGSNMGPDGYVGPTTGMCQLTQDEMIFKCAVSFSGETPQMTWKTLNVSQSFNESTCKTENGRITCSLITRTDPKYDGSIFNCQLRDSSVNCSTEVIKIHYFEHEMSRVVVKNLGDKVNCEVKSNQRLQFSWIRIQDDQRVNVTNDQELSIQSLGLYQCYVEYSIRNLLCYTIVIDVNVQNVPNPNTTPSTTSQDADQSSVDASTHLDDELMLQQILSQNDRQDADHSAVDASTHLDAELMLQQILSQNNRQGTAAISVQSRTVVTSILVIIALVVHSRPNMF